MLRLCRFVTILLVSLSMGMAFSHALEFIPKMRYTGSLYLTVQRTLYPLFGVPLGASIEVGAVATSVLLTLTLLAAHLWGRIAWHALPGCSRLVWPRK
jgi:hypothetical protein